MTHQQIRDRADQLHRSGDYPSWTAAHQAAQDEAVREATRQHRDYIDRLES